MILAILRAQILSMRLAPTRGAIFSAITSVVWYGFWGMIAAGAGLWTASAGPDALRRFLPVGCLFICVYWQVIPILTASMGSALDLRKLLLYPIPHRKLFTVEILLRFTTAFEMILIVAGGSAGLVSNQGWSALPRVITAVAGLILFNLLLASGMRSLIERLLSRRRVREVLVFFLLALWMIPRLIVESGFHPHWLDSALVALVAFGLPWSAAAHAAVAGSGSFTGSIVSLALWTLIAGWFGRLQFERNLRYDAVAAQATPLTNGTSRTRSAIERFYRYPSMIFRDPLAAMIEKELRSLMRSPRYRMVFVMGFSFGIMLWLPLVIGRHSGQHGTLANNFLPIVSIYALTLLGQVSYWNCFGFDRSAAQIYFLAPVRLGTALAAKNIASLTYIYLEVAILIALNAILRMISGWQQVVETLLVMGIGSLYMLALGNISSVQFPRGLSPERVSHGGASSRFQALIFIFYPVTLLPIFLAYLARYAFRSDFMFYAVLMLAAIIGGTIYWIAMDSSVSTARSRREYIIQQLSKGEGPVVSE